ncbi:hypothetical protein Bca4012_032733 [Brassica carinata]
MATCLLDPFLETSEDQIAKDSNSASWFTKGTIQREKAKKIRNSLTKHGHSYHHDHDHEEEYDEQKPKWHSEPAGQPETPSPPGETNFWQWTKVFQFVSSDYTKPVELEPLRDIFHEHKMTDTSYLMICYLSLFCNQEARIQVFKFERNLSIPSYHVLLHQCCRDACLKFMDVWKKSTNLVREHESVVLLFL